MSSNAPVRHPDALDRGLEHENIDTYVHDTTLDIGLALDRSRVCLAAYDDRNSPPSDSGDGRNEKCITRQIHVRPLSASVQIPLAAVLSVRRRLIYALSMEGPKGALVALQHLLEGGMAYPRNRI